MPSRKDWGAYPTSAPRYVGEVITTRVDRHLYTAHLLGLVVLTLFAAGVPMQGTLPIGIVLLAMTAVARQVMSLCGVSGPSLNLVAALSGLLVIGGSVTFFTVLFGVAFSVTAFVIVAAALFIVGLRSCRKVQTSPDDSDQLMVLYGLAVICALGLTIKLWYFMVPFVVALVAALFVLRPIVKRSHRSKSKTWTLVCLIPLVLGASWSHHLALEESSEGLIFRSADQFFRAALAFSTVRYGPSEHVGAIGYDLKTHWLSEAMMGMLSLASRESVLDVVLRASPPLAVFAAGLAGFFVAQVLGLSNKQGLFAVGLLVLLSNLLHSLGLNILKSTEMGQLWGTSFFLFGFAILVLFFSQPSVRVGLLLSWFSVLLLMTNITLGMVLAGSALLVVVQHLISKRNTRVNVFIGIALLGGLGVLSQTLLKSTEKGDFSPQYGLQDPFGYAYVLGYSGNNPWVKLAGATALVTLMWFQGGAYVPRQNKEPASWFRSPVLPFAYAFIVAICGASFIQIGTFEQYRFLLAILILMPTLAARNLDVSGLRRSSLSWVVPTVVVAAIAGWLSRDFLEKSFGGATFFLPRLAYVFFLVFTPFAAWLVFAIFRRWKASRDIPLLGSVVLLFAVVASASHTTRETAEYVEYSSILTSPSVVNAQRYDCLEFVKRESQQDERIATTMWRWSDDYFSEKWYLASAVSERMTYIDGPLYVQLPRSNWLQDRADLTLRFAESPNTADLAELQSWAVTWFVADKNWPTTSDWSSVGSVAMANEKCVVVKLRTT